MRQPLRATARPARTGARHGLISRRRRSISSTRTAPPSGCGHSRSVRHCRHPRSGKRGTWRSSGTWRTTIRRRPSRAASASGWLRAVSPAAGARTSQLASRRLHPSSTVGSARPATAPTSRMRATSRWAPALRRAHRASSTGHTRSRPAEAGLLRRRRPRRRRPLRRPFQSLPRLLLRRRPLRPSNPEAAGAARAARGAAGAEDGLGREPAELPPVDAHPTAAVSWSRPREPGGRPEAGSAAEDRPRVLQREVPGPPIERADAEPPCRVGRLRVAASCRSSRLAGQRHGDRGAGPPAGRGAVPHQDLLTPA